MVAETYIPKEATQQTEFLEKYPEYDGRGIKIAVIDTDVADTSLPGMQKTSTGLPKIINNFGRRMITVDTSTIIETQFANKKKFITGLSGRYLNIPSTWKNESDKWHLGKVSVETLFSVVTPSIKNEKKQKVNKRFKKLNIKSIDAYEYESLKDKIIDCIVWFDGEKWRACLDTSFFTKNLNLGFVKVLTNYEDEYEFAHFDKNYIYCINVIENGNSINIMHPHHYHGTLVAHVAAAYFHDRPESNGIAPGVQIVSVNSQNLEIALLKCIELEVDIVNISIGFELSECMEVKNIFKKMVEEHGIIITYAAENDGPFYSTILPQDSVIADIVLFIGSILTADQQKLKQIFHFKESINSVNNFSSKGPLPCGARGVDFVAPGTAIIDLPKWYSQKNKACYGTSFAAPQVAGSIACLLSALKANNIPYSPSMIKMALANTAYLPINACKLAYGNGLIQINDAFEFIKKSIYKLPLKTLTPISIDQPDKKGILCNQNKNESAKTFRYYVNMDSALDTKWILKCSPNGEKFISYSKTDNFFMVTIDANLLEEGSLNYAEIYGINPLNPSIGPLFNLPITVICPAESFIDKEICLKPNSTNHFFFKCPSESQECHILITSLENEDREIVLEFRRIASEELFSERILKFSSKKKVRNLSFQITKREEPFEICIYNTYINALNFKFNIDFQNIPTINSPLNSSIEKEIVIKPGQPTNLFFECPSESQQCNITFTLLNVTNERKISLKFLQNKNLIDHRVLKFSLKKKSRSLSFRMTERKEPYELSISHTHLNDLSLKLDFKNETL